MPASLGSRVVLAHGPLINVLVALGLIDQIRVANICRSTYDIKVTWNTPPLKLPVDSLCSFPNLQIPSDAFVCKRIKATIDGISGQFFGIVCRQTDLPDGYGVFKVADWVHCGQFKDGKFHEGRRVSINKGERLFKLTNQKCFADGSFIENIELFSEQGMERFILKGGQKIVEIIPRLTVVKDAQNWLSMRPNPLRWYD